MKLKRTSNALRHGLVFLAITLAVVAAPGSASAIGLIRSENSAPAVTKPSEQRLVGKSVPSMQEAAGRAFKGLVYTIAVLGLVLSIIKRIKSPKLSALPTPIEIIARKNLSSRVSLVVVEVDGRKLLLSQGPEEARLITELGMAQDAFVELLGGDNGLQEEDLPRAAHQ